MKFYNPSQQSRAASLPLWLCGVPIERLSLGAKLMYAVLASHCDESGVCAVPQSELADCMGICPRQAFRYLKELNEVGLIVTVRKGLSMPNEYKFVDLREVRL